MATSSIDQKFVIKDMDTAERLLVALESPCRLPVPKEESTQDENQQVLERLQQSLKD